MHKLELTVSCSSTTQVFLLDLISAVLQVTHRLINGVRVILLLLPLPFSPIQGHLDLRQLQQVLGLVVLLLGGATADGVEGAVAGEGVLATQLKGVAHAPAGADGVVAAPAVVALDGVLGRQGATVVPLDGVLGAQRPLVVQGQVPVAVAVGRKELRG